MNQSGRRRPSAALVVAIIALVVAASGSAFAAGTLVNGDTLIREGSLSGNRLQDHTLDGQQIDLARLGRVPLAKDAEHATTAASATSAKSAKSALTSLNAAFLGGKPASDYLTTSGAIGGSAGSGGGSSSGGGGGGGSIVGTGGIIKLSATAAGATVNLVKSGPFQLTMTCSSSSDGPSLTVLASSTEDQSDLDGQFVSANTPTDIGDDLYPIGGPEDLGPSVIDFEAPSGAQLVLDGTVGESSLNTDCWANFTGVS
ncbi:MAG: hypothetical protein ABSH51_21215 [Solirubrobacteraceae bacterium]|jgi:hypothetical protein